MSVLVTVAAGAAVFRYAGPAEGGQLDRTAFEQLDGREYLVGCEACGKQFKMSAKAYLLLAASREPSSNDGVLCSHCGALRAWRVYGERRREDDAGAGTSVNGDAPAAVGTMAAGGTNE